MKLLGNFPRLLGRTPAATLHEMCENAIFPMSKNVSIGVSDLAQAFLCSIENSASVSIFL
jgi:hypothetical protein